MTATPVSRFLDSTIEWAGKAGDPRADRLALLASDLIAKAASQRGSFLEIARRDLGFVGPAGGSAPANSTAQRVLERAQASLDGDDPEPAAVAAGIQAARRLLAADAGSDQGALQIFMARLLSGGKDHREPPAYLVEGTPEAEEYWGALPPSERRGVAPRRRSRALRGRR